MRTIVYVDGYNLYYARLRGTRWKWLDLFTLFDCQLLHPQNPSNQLIAIRYFTAPIKANYARHGQESSQAQMQYHRALSAAYPGHIEIVEGFHIFQPTALPTYEEGQSPRKDAISKVWMLEEKQTDVNIALHAYRDAIRGVCDQVVICSNDSDLEPVLRMIRQDAPHIQIGLITPLRERHSSQQGQVSNKRLTALADWVRSYIRDDELEKSQLPAHVPTKKKPAVKPVHW